MGFIFDFFHFIGALFVGGVTLVVAAAAGAWIGGFLSVMVTASFTEKERVLDWAVTSGLLLFLAWAVFCLFTAASVGAALVSVIGLLAFAAVVCVIAFITCAT